MSCSQSTGSLGPSQTGRQSMESRQPVYLSDFAAAGRQGGPY